MKILPLFVIGLLLIAGFHSSEAQAQDRVDCRSTGYAYQECRAPWQSARMVKQVSKTRCVKDVNWGLHLSQRVLWVSEGCGGVFETTDRKSSSSNSTTAAVVGVAAGVAAGAVLMNQHDKRKQRERDERAVYNTSTYTGCHGTGCLVDDPDAPVHYEIDTTPQFDADGNPNFDEHGNYQGCHGMGCVTDDPDQQD